MTKPAAKSTQATAAGLVVTGMKLPALPRPEGALIERAAGNGSVTVTAAGLAAIKAWAILGVTQEGISAELGVGIVTFKKLLGLASADPATEVRLAWEAGFAINESDLLRGLNIQARNGNTTALIVLLKMVHERRDAGPQVVIENGQRIQFTPYQLPAPMTDEQGALVMGPVIDTRANKLIREHMKLIGKSAAQIDEYLLSIGRDVNDDGTKMKLINPPNKGE